MSCYVEQSEYTTEKVVGEIVATLHMFLGDRRPAAHCYHEM